LIAFDTRPKSGASSRVGLVEIDLVPRLDRRFVDPRGVADDIGHQSGGTVGGVNWYGGVVPGCENRMEMG
jgi:hypothetical protein